MLERNGEHGASESDRFDYIKDAIELINTKLGGGGDEYHIMAMMLCSACCQTGVDMYLLYIFLEVINII